MRHYPRGKRLEFERNRVFTEDLGGLNEKRMRSQRNIDLLLIDSHFSQNRILISVASTDGGRVALSINIVRLTAWLAPAKAFELFLIGCGLSVIQKQRAFLYLVSPAKQLTFHYTISRRIKLCRVFEKLLVKARKRFGKARKSKLAGARKSNEKSFRDKTVFYGIDCTKGFSTKRWSSIDQLEFFDQRI